jgi:hypothetical protein
VARTAHPCRQNWNTLTAFEAMRQLRRSVLPEGEVGTFVPFAQRKVKIRFLRLHGHRGQTLNVRQVLTCEGAAPFNQLGRGGLIRTFRPGLQQQGVRSWSSRIYAHSLRPPMPVACRSPRGGLESPSPSSVAGSSDWKRRLVSNSLRARREAFA